MISKYTFLELIKTTISYCYTKLFYKNARLVRLPIYIRNKKFLKYDEGFTTGYRCRLEMFDNKNKDKKIIIGKNCKIGDNVHITSMEKIIIGNNVLMGSHILITDNNHGIYDGEEKHSNPNEQPDKREYKIKKVLIEDNVWIGDNVCILPGTKIGKGSIIGANAVVNKDIPDYCIAVGVPARVVKSYNFEKNRWEKIKS